MEENLAVTIADHLPKYIQIKKISYMLVIRKNEWDGHSNAWIIMYVKDTFNDRISTKKPLLRAEGNNLLDALKKMENLISQFRKENKGNPNVHRC